MYLSLTSKFLQQKFQNLPFKKNAVFILFSTTLLLVLTLGKENTKQAPEQEYNTNSVSAELALEKKTSSKQNLVHAQALQPANEGTSLSNSAINVASNKPTENSPSSANDIVQNIPAADVLPIPGRAAMK